MSEQTVPPRLLEKIGGVLLPWQEREFVLGDLAEIYGEGVGENGRFSQTIWYINQLICAIVPSLQLRLGRLLKRRFGMFHPIRKEDTHRFLISLLLLIPAALIVSTGLLHSFFGITAPMNNLFDFYRDTPLMGWMAHPLTVFGGMVVALGLSVWPFFTFSGSRKELRAHGSVTLTQGSVLSWIVFGVCGLMAAIVFLYLLAENFGYLLR